MGNDLSRCNVSLVASIAYSDTSRLNAFDRALRNAGIQDCNLVKVSSVIPRGAVYVDLDPTRHKFKKGILLPVAYTYLYINTDFIKNVSNKIYFCQVSIAPITKLRDGGVIFECSDECDINNDLSSFVLKQMITEAMQDRGITINDEDIKSVSSIFKVHREMSAEEKNLLSHKYLCLFAACILWRNSWLDEKNCSNFFYLR